MSQDKSQEELPTCSIDHEVALVEEAPMPNAASQPPLIDNANALSALDEGEKTRAERAIEARRNEAMAIPADGVDPFQQNAVLIKQNVDAGYKVLKPHLEKLRKQLPREVNEKIERIRETALALIFVTAIAAREAKAPPTAREALNSVYKFRRLFLRSAEALVEAGLLDANRVNLIKEGSGAKDAVDDVIALVDLFRDEPELRALTPIKESALLEASELTAAMSPSLKVPGSRVEKEKPVPTKNAELRDRLWTLLKDEWDAVFAAGALLWGTKVTRHLSPLQSRSRTPSSTGQTAAQAQPPETGTG